MPRLVYKDPAIRVLQWHEKVPKEVEPYEYKTRRTARIEPQFAQPPTPPEEILTGFVHGQRASALEERFAKALEFFGLDYIFQYEVVSAYSLPNEGKLIDFIVFDGGIGIPVEVGSKFVHQSTSDQEKERERDNVLNAILPLLGFMPISDEFRVPLDRPYDLEDAKSIVASLFINA